MRQAFTLEEVMSPQTRYLRGMNRWLEVLFRVLPGAV